MNAGDKLQRRFDAALGAGGFSSMSLSDAIMDMVRSLPI
jgi:hypothetical protein